MLEVLEKPVPYFADPERAREARARQTELAQQAKQELENLRLILASKPLEEQKPQSQADSEANKQIILAEKLIAHALERIENTTDCFCPECKRGGIDDKAKAALMREIRGFQEHICMLRGIAPVKPTAARHGQVRPTIAPAIPQPIAAPEQSGPGTGTGTAQG